MVKYILEFLVLAGCILLTIKPDISNYKPQQWWTKRKIMFYRLVFAVCTLIMGYMIIQTIMQDIGG